MKRSRWSASLPVIASANEQYLDDLEAAADVVGDFTPARHAVVAVVEDRMPGLDVTVAAEPADT